MKQGKFVRAMALALAGAVMVTSGCVLVVGGDRGNPQAEVEWARPSSHGTAAAPGSVNGSLAREVETRIRVDTALASEDISVSSSGNVVTLHGRVSDVSRLEHVMRVAADVPGVARVVSRLTVEMEGG
jgi:osmotically-inducible protein OsmY